MPTGGSVARGIIVPAIVLSIAGTAVAKRPSPPPPGMPVAIEVLPACKGVPAGKTATNTPGSMVIALNALSGSRTASLAEALEKLARRLERRKNPFFVDVGEPEEQAKVERLLNELSPVLTAASTLTAGTWSASGGDLCVRPVAACRSGGATCFALDGSAHPTEPTEARARFLAWPLAQAILLRASSNPAAAAMAERLRMTGPVDTSVALTLSARDLHRLRRSPALTILLRNAARVANLYRGQSPQLAAMLEALVGAGTARDPLPWLQLPVGGVLVVPRLSALATIASFTDEVRTTLAAAGLQ